MAGTNWGRRYLSVVRVWSEGLDLGKDVVGLAQKAEIIADGAMKEKEVDWNREFGALNAGLVAVMEKKLGMHLMSHDIFMNVAGGVKAGRLLETTRDMDADHVGCRQRRGEQHDRKAGVGQYRKQGANQHVEQQVEDRGRDTGAASRHAGCPQRADTFFHPVA